APALSAAIARVDKDQPVTRIRTMQEVAAEAMSQPRFRARIVSTFATIAMVLAAVGVFGVVAYSVSPRSRELGLRIALRAPAADVLRLVPGGALAMTATGVCIGLAAAAMLTRFLATLLYHVEPLDPIAFLTAASVLVASTLAACALPAWRAVRVDPARALR